MHFSHRNIWLGGLLLTILVNFILKIPFLGVIAFACWCVIATDAIARKIEDKLGRGVALFLASIVLFSAVTTGSLVVFFLLPFNALAIGAMILLLSVPIFFLSKNLDGLNVNYKSVLQFFNHFTRIDLFVILLQIVTLLFLVVARTSQPLISPWTILPETIFIFFFTSSALITLQKNSQPNIRWLCIIIQTFIALNVSNFVYGVGFGFDPFIHRAAEQALITTGKIEPTTLLYSGQYALVGALHFLTQLPIKIIDIWLLPILASFFLPFSGYFGLRYGWKVTMETAYLGWIFPLFIPFMLYTFTVPFTFTYVVFASLLFLFPIIGVSFISAIILPMLCVVMIAFHPLLAVPTLLFILTAVYLYRFNKEKKFILNAVALIALVTSCMTLIPILLFAYQHSAGMTVNLQNIISNVQSFKNLFLSPFAPWDNQILWSYNLLYAWRYWQPMIFTVTAIAWLLCFAGQHRANGLLLIAFALGLLGCIYNVSTLFTFKDIIAGEQSEFALRLLQATYIVMLPAVAVMLDRLHNHRHLYQFGAIILVFVATLSWYFSYPQYNAKYPYNSPSVSSDYVEAVRYIDNESQELPYIVLSDQLLSAAALQEFGFAHYYSLNNEQVLWYAIPTGGQLYGYYLSAITTGDSVSIQSLLDNADVDRVYLVLPLYWQWSDDVIRSLTKSADDTHLINQQIIIFRFDAYDEVKNSDENKNNIKD